MMLEKSGAELGRKMKRFYNTSDTKLVRVPTFALTLLFLEGRDSVILSQLWKKLSSYLNFSAKTSLQITREEEGNLRKGHSAKCPVLLLPEPNKSFHP